VATRDKHLAARTIDLTRQIGAWTCGQLPGTSWTQSSILVLFADNSVDMTDHHPLVDE
jgi:hypothetical protein